jgi:Leucine-rich repeat (LRR) protein
MAQHVISPREWLESLWRNRFTEHNHLSAHVYQLFPVVNATPVLHEDATCSVVKEDVSTPSSDDIVEESTLVITSRENKKKRRRKQARSRHGKHGAPRDDDVTNYEEETLCTMLNISKRDIKSCVKTNNQKQIISLNCNSMGKDNFFIQHSILFNNLSRLDLFNNSLSEFPSCICDITCLKDLQLSKNNLKCIPETVGNLKNLVKFSIQSNKIYVLPKSICNLLALKELYVSNNALTKIPGNIGSIKNLTTLAVGGNKIFWLPKSIGKLKKIQLINAENNRIRTIPKSFAKISCLRWLDLTGNDIFEAPIFLDKNKNLRVKL